MNKKFLSSLLMILSLMLFVSCQETSKDVKVKNMQKHDQKMYNGKSKDRCPPSRPCPPKKECPSKCKEKCCVSDTEEQNESNELSDSSNLKQDKMMPLEELKASIESQNKTLDITEAETDTLNLE